MSLTHTISTYSPSYHLHTSSKPASSRMGFLRKIGITGSKAQPTRPATPNVAFSPPVADLHAPSRTTPTRRPRASMELPPTYDETINSTAQSPRLSAINTAANTAPAAAGPFATTVTNDSPYAFLAQFDTIFLVDDSGSMQGQKWRDTAQALAAITPTCTAYDADGVDIFFMNHRNRRNNSGLAPGGYVNINSTTKVLDIFDCVRPCGGTPTGTRLHQILKPYLANLETSIRSQSPSSATIKPINIIVITDGLPQDAVEEVIVSAAEKLDRLEADPWQIGIQFYQVGDDRGAAEHLRALDDDLRKEYEVRDMVDTTAYDDENGGQLSADTLLKILLGSVNKRLDRLKIGGETQQRN